MTQFIVIGCAKGGTTSLYQYLQQHPQIFMSPVKEPKFFEYTGHDLIFGNPLDVPMLRRAGVVLHLGDYEALFRGVSGEKAVGECSPSYLYCPEVPRRIHRLIPQAKLIAILRNPVDRAYSNFLHFRRQGVESEPSFMAALRQEDQRLKNGWSSLWALQEKGFYFKQLSRYFAIFNQEQIRIFLFEDLLKNPGALLRDIFGFLGVDPDFCPDLSTKWNTGSRPRNRLVVPLIKNYVKYDHLFRQILPLSFRKKLRALALTQAPSIPAEARVYLTDNYRQDIHDLQTLIDRDLSHWMSDFQDTNS